MQAGARGEALYMVLSGTLQVHLPTEGEPCVARIEAGDSVGELSLLTDQPVSAHVRAWEECRLLVVGEDVFWGLVTASHELAANLLLLLARRLRSTNSTVTETLRRQRRFEHAAMFDSLTAVHNRRWLDETLPRLVARHLRDGQPLSVLMLDVDHFKKFNDRHGHPAGDRVLKEVLRAVVRGLRPTDLVARYGGEEFVILLPATPRDGAVHAAERIRVAVHEGVRVKWYEEILPPVTVSIGVAQLEPDGDGEGLLEEADQAMYRAKASGRNRVCAV
jgi:diguanylate cyclase (GGDEF)-like protein